MLLNCLKSKLIMLGVMVINSDGIPIRTTVPQAKTAHLVGLLHGFIIKTKSTIKEMDNQNDLTFIRLRSQKDEILIAPDRGYIYL